MTVHRTDAAPREPGFALVTGASSGIGLGFARQLAKDGVNLVLVARHEAPLQEVKAELEASHGIKARIFARDLADPDAAGEIFDSLKEEGIVLSWLFNNAGFNVYGRFEETELEDELSMIRLHIVAMTQLTKLFLLQRPAAGPIRILNVSSIAAFVPGPNVSVHFATRAHALSFSLALSDEFRGTNVDVTCLCPGPTRSAFFGRAGMADVRLASGRPMPIMEADAVAAIGYAALKRGRRLVVPGRLNRLFAFMAANAPRGPAIAFTRWVMSRRG